MTEMPPSLDAAANAVAAALGACAARDRTYTSLAKDEATAEVNIREKTNQLIEKHSRLVAQYKSQGIGEWLGEHKSKAILLERIKSLRTEIETLSKQIEQLHASHTPGYLLLVVLKNAQLYPTSVRQGAAWGLKLLCYNGHLDATSRACLLNTVRECVAGNERDRFCERVVRLLPGMDVSEMAEALDQGLEWMTNLVRDSDTETVLQSAVSTEYKKTAQQRTSAETNEYDRLPQIVGLMCETMPGALAFLE
ncbi:MAG: hypothetical protein ACREDR_40995, partial [Blastocatellia bacterium]